MTYNNPFSGKTVLPLVDISSLLTLDAGEMVMDRTTGVVYHGGIDNSKIAFQQGAEYILPTATAAVLGGVKIGSRITIASGIISADIQTANDFTNTLKSKLDGIEAGAVAPSYLIYTALLNQTTGVVESLKSLVGGTGYDEGTNVATTGGTGSGLTVDITVDGGIIQTAIINNRGTGYTADDVLTITGGNADATVTVDTVTNPLTVTVLENTLSGAIAWTNPSAGVFQGTLSNAFTANKTITCLLNDKNLNTSASDTILMVRNSVNRIDINTYSDAYTTLADGVLLNTPIEIRVYP
jgi:hypothetical protein